MASSEICGSNLLDALRAEERALLKPHLREIELPGGRILYHPGDDVQQCYFPRFGAVASFHVVMAEGAAVETGIVGREGAVGGIVSHGRLPAFARCCVMHGGAFYTIATTELEHIKASSPHMARLFARYADCLLAQMFQAIACNASHTIEQRAARWLLAAMDRTGTHRVAMTQDQLASVLGVGRSYVSRVIRRLKECGAVETRRGFIVVLDRQQLEQISCGCEALVAEHFDTVLKGVYPGIEDDNIAAAAR